MIKKYNIFATSILTLLLIIANKNYTPQKNTKKPWTGNNQFLINNLKKYPLLDSGKIYFKIPITFHIYNSTKVPNYYFYDDIKKLINRLNKIYAKNKTGIQFYPTKTIIYNNNKHLITRYYTETPIISLKNKNKYTINIYYVDIITKKFLNKKKYYHGLFNSITKTITIIKHSAKTTLAHEIGHFLGLEHPHKNWNKNKIKQESVSRTRTKGTFKKKKICETNGDQLADTPAEPDLIKYSNDKCKYTGKITDKWGDKYKPNTNNIMSYPANRTCRTNFTNMQKSVMLYTANNNKYAKYWKNKPENKHFNADKYEPDDNFFQANELSENCNFQYHTFNAFPTAKNKIQQNNIDYFTLNTNKKQITLIIKKATETFPKILLTIIQNDTTYKKNITTETKINIPVKNNKIAIILENKSKIIPGEKLDYKLKITSTK